MRTLALLLVGLSISSFSYAQHEPKTSDQSISKNTIFIEGLGNSLTVGMINYDRILVNKEKWKFAGRLGFSFFPGKDAYFGFVFPSEFTFLVGKTKHFFEAGLGATYLFEINSSGGKDNLHGKDNWSSIYLVSRIGYRYQRPQGGFFLKAGFNTVTPLNQDALGPPYHTNQRIAWPWGGVGIGYTFKQRKNK